MYLHGPACACNYDMWSHVHFRVDALHHIHWKLPFVRCPLIRSRAPTPKSVGVVALTFTGHALPHVFADITQINLASAQPTCSLVICVCTRVFSLWPPCPSNPHYSRSLILSQRTFSLFSSPKPPDPPKNPLLFNHLAHSPLFLHPFEYRLSSPSCVLHLQYTANCEYIHCHYLQTSFAGIDRFRFKRNVRWFPLLVSIIFKFLNIFSRFL